MNSDILIESNIWNLNELRAMVHDGDLFPFHSAFVTWQFLETSHSRLGALKLMYRARAFPVGKAALWVQEGGPLPSEIELQEPRRKRYC